VSRDDTLNVLAAKWRAASRSYASAAHSAGDGESKSASHWLGRTAAILEIVEDLGFTANEWSAANARTAASEVRP
jgi:hypothetical protein